MNKLESGTGFTGIFEEPTKYAEMSWNEICDSLIEIEKKRIKAEQREEAFVGGRETLEWIKQKESEGWVFKYKRGWLLGIKPK